MRRLAAGTLILGLLCSIAQAGTRVWNLTGWGPQGWSSGIFQIAEKEKAIPGVTYVRVYAWYETQRVADEMMAAPAGDKLVVVGYSCGANSATVIAYGLIGHRNVY